MTISPNEQRRRERKESGVPFYETGEGWHDMIDKMVHDLRLVDPTVEIKQIKEKFGLLRVYISGNEDAYEIIDAYEKLSATICEKCGSTEDVTTDGDGWIYTMCKECRNNG